MSDQYQPTAYYDWVNRTHGVHLVTGNYQLVPYDYYAGDELHLQNIVFRNSEYVTYDNTHVRFLNKSDIHVYDTSSLVIHDSGTLTMHTSSAPGARTFIVDEIGRVGIGMNHIGVHSNHSESPSFDLDVRGQVGIEDYIYHNDDIDTYMLFGSDLSAHHVNTDGSTTPPTPPPGQDYNEINFRVGGIDMIQMQTRDYEITPPVTTTGSGAVVATGAGWSIGPPDGDLSKEFPSPVNGTQLRIIGNVNTGIKARYELQSSEPGDPPVVHLSDIPNPNNLGLDSSITYNKIIDTTSAIASNPPFSSLNAKVSWIAIIQLIVDDLNQNFLPERAESFGYNWIARVSHNWKDLPGIHITDIIANEFPTGFAVAIGIDNLISIQGNDYTQLGYPGQQSSDSGLAFETTDDGNTTTSPGVTATQDHVTINKYQADVDTVIRTSTNTQAVVVSGDGSEVVINGDGNSDTNFRIESDKSEKMLFVDASTDMITLSGPGGDDTAIFDIQGNDDDNLTGASLLYVDPTETVLNKDANDHNFRVVAQGLDPQQDTTDTGTDGNVQNHTAALASHALFVDATNGRVGIGHNNPSTTLHVAGSAHIEGDLWVKGVTNQIDTLIHATSAMDITNIGTGPALTVTQSGAQPVAVFWDRDNNDTLQASLYLDDMTRMGVGTSSPEHAVHISDTVESQAGSDLVTVMVDHNYNHGGIGINSTNKNHQNHVRFLSGGDQTWQLRQPLHYTADPDSLRFTHSSRSFDVITMIPTGDVGIGVQRGTDSYSSAPQYRLQIAGNGAQDIVQITTNDTELTVGQEQGLTFGQVDRSFGKIAGFYQGTGKYGLKLYSCLETSRPSETRGNFRYNDLAGITLLGDNKTGINIEVPTAQLHVYRADQHETHSGLTVHRGDTSVGIRTTAPILNVFNGSAGATEVFRVQGDGKTGIGTDDPDTALHVQRKFNTGTTTATRTALQPLLTLAADRGTGDTPHTGFGPSIDFKSVNYEEATPGPHPLARIAASITNSSGTHTGGSLRFFTTPLDTATSNDDLVENMVIKPSGNIGMGTLVPDDYNDEANNLVVQSKGHTGLTIASIPAGDDKYRGNIYFADAASGTGEYSGAITYDHADDNMSFRTSSYERMWITDNGYVGIGIDTPSAKLDIRKGGGSQYATANDFLKNPSGQHALALSTGGWRNASVINQQTGVTTANLTLASTGLYLNSSYGAKPFSSSSIHVNCDTSNGDISFLTGNGDTAPTTKVKIINNGNVGIGSSTPHTKLYIESTDGLRIPVGTTSQRPINAAFGITASTPTNEQYVPKLGTIRYNTTQSTFEGFGPGNQWGSLGGVIDVDRDTYWTAINDLDNLHDLGGAKYGTDEFDPNTEYPGDVDYLRAFTVGKKRMAINPEGKADFYHFAGGAGSVADPYTYEAMVRIECTHTSMGTIYNPTITKDIRITTLNIGNNSNATAGNTLIESGEANDRIPTSQGSGGNAGKIKITSGDGANGYGGNSNGGNGGDIEISAGGGGARVGTGIAGANGAITLQSSSQVHVNNSGLSVTGALAAQYISRPGAHLGYASNYAYMELKGTDGSYIDFGPGAPNTGTTTWGDHICRIIQTGNDFSIVNTQNHITLNAGKDVVITKHDGTNGLTLGTTLVKATGAEINYLDNDDLTAADITKLAAITASAVKINYLDNADLAAADITKLAAITASAVKINFVSDVTSNIQAQINAKAPTDNAVFTGTTQVSALGVGMAPTATPGEINASADIIAFSSSDERLKENVTPISDPIEKLSKIGGYEFDWKDNDECSHTGHDVGVIAQEIEQVLPDIVTTRDSGYKAVKYEKLTALLIEVTKSQQAQIDELKRQVEQLSK